MGARHSKLSPEAAMHEKAVLERIRALHTDDDFDEESYVSVHHEKPLRDMAFEREPEGLAVSTLESWQSKLLQDPKNRLALSALSGANPKEVLTSRATQIADQQAFNVRIPFEGAPITNQRSSGRCWLFASTNVFRIALMRRYGLGSFELSQAYLFFWDKLEKANFFLESVIATAGSEDLGGRLVQRLLADPASDGGQWDMVCNLVDKYGLVPQALYPDSWNAMASSTLNYVVVAKLREYALTLRQLLNNPQTVTTAENLAATKQQMLREIHLVLVLMLGPPPSPSAPFEWTYEDQAGRAHTVRKTPREFARDITPPPSPSPSPSSLPWPSSSPSSSSSAAETALRTLLTPAAIASHVSLVHDPRHPAPRLLTVDRLGNVVGGRGVTYINAGMGVLKAACVAMLSAGLPVFFGSDVGKFSSSASGVMDLDLVDYRLGFNVDLVGGMTKAQRLRVGESAMTHAMVLTAVHVEEEDGDGDGAGGRGRRTVRWRVQNSWGESVGEKGWFVMSDRWMDEFVYQAVVDPRFLSREVRDVLKQDPIVLPLWDPMGSLA